MKCPALRVFSHGTIFFFSGFYKIKWNLAVLSYFDFKLSTFRSEMVNQEIVWFFTIVYLNPLFLSFLLSFFPFSVSLVFFTFHLWCQCTWNLKRRKKYFRLPRTRLNPLTCARKHLRNLWLLTKNFFSWLQKWKLFSVTTNWYNGKLLTNFTREHHAALLERTLIRVPCSSTRNVT